MLETIQKLKGKASVLIKKPYKEILFTHNHNEIFSAASLIKLPVMYAAYKLAELGEIKLEKKILAKEELIVPGTGEIRHTGVGKEFSIVELIYLMITVSDNTATNILIDLLGYDKVNFFCRQIGMHGTKLARKMYDFDSLKRGIDNLTSPADVALIYEKFLDENEFTPSHRAEILRTLAEQKLNNKIPVHLPGTIKVMHKTGEIPHVEHDAGILDKNGQRLILVIMTNDLESNQDGINFCAEIAKQVCERFLN